MKALDKQVAGSHYKGMAIQPIEFCQKNKLRACETHAIGYICRHQKDGGAEDIRKAIHMLEILLEMEYTTSGSSTLTACEVRDDKPWLNQPDNLARSETEK